MSQWDSDEQSDGAPSQWDRPPRHPTSSRLRHLLLIAAGIVVLAGVGAWAVGLWSPTEQPHDGPVAGDTANEIGSGISLFRVGHRVSGPALDGDTVEGPALQSQSLQGKVVVVNVWGSWCGPCRAEAPDLSRVARETISDGVSFVGIDVRDDRASARAFARRYAVAYQSLFDPDGKQLVKFSSIIPINAVPSTVILDRAGRVAARVVGPVKYRTLKGMVQDVVAESSASGTP